MGYSRLPWRVVTSALAAVLSAVSAILTATGAGAAFAMSADYGPAVWAPASPSNYTVADRPHDYPIDMIIIHDTETSYAKAISIFRDPTTHVSAHYVVSQTGNLAQMVAEKNIAWHAGNWDYNTRSIGIEHEGYAYTPNSFTPIEYQVSAHLIASICSRWGVPLDRNHVIGHYQVPDPNNPGLYGGDSHHTDPGPYWSWGYYMGLAQTYAKSLPSPPHMVLNAVAVAGIKDATLTWPAARTCRVPIASYQVVGEPGDLVKDLPGTTTATTFTGLQVGVAYTFTVTAINSYGQDSLTTNTVTPYTVPSAPSGVVATAANGSAVVAWPAPPYDGARPIIGYQITPYADGITPLPPVTFHVTNTLLVVSGLTNGVPYTFVVAAINIGGPGAPSAPTNSVVPSAADRPAAAQASPSSAPTRAPPAPSSPNPTPQPR